MTDVFQNLLDWFGDQDRADWAFYIACMSLFAAGFSAFYTRKMARLEVEKNKRKAPVLEIENSRQMSYYSKNGRKDYPGYYETSFLVKNIQDSFSVRIEALIAKRGARICFIEALQVSPGSPTNIFEPELLADFPDGAFAKKLDINWKLRPRGTPRHQSGIAGDSMYRTVYSKSPITHKNLAIEWSWADGEKR